MIISVSLLDTVRISLSSGLVVEKRKKMIDLIIVTFFNTRRLLHFLYATLSHDSVHIRVIFGLD